MIVMETAVDGFWIDLFIIRGQLASCCAILMRVFNYTLELSYYLLYKELLSSVFVLILQAFQQQIYVNTDLSYF